MQVEFGTIRATLNILIMPWTIPWKYINLDKWFSLQIH